MINFEIIVTNEKDADILVVMKTSEPPFDYISEIRSSLVKMNFKGWILIDEMLHSGNTDERFIKGYFDGNKFEENRFAFEHVERRSKLREYMCLYLYKDKESLELSALTSRQQKLIKQGCVI